MKISTAALIFPTVVLCCWSCSSQPPKNHDDNRAERLSEVGTFSEMFLERTGRLPKSVPELDLQNSILPGRNEFVVGEKYEWKDGGRERIVFDGKPEVIWTFTVTQSIPGQESVSMNRYAVMPAKTPR